MHTDLKKKTVIRIDFRFTTFFQKPTRLGFEKTFQAIFCPLVRWTQWRMDDVVEDESSLMRVFFVRFTFYTMQWDKKATKYGNIPKWHHRLSKSFSFSFFASSSNYEKGPHSVRFLFFFPPKLSGVSGNKYTSKCQTY